MLDVGNNPQRHARAVGPSQRLAIDYCGIRKPVMLLRRGRPFRHDELSTYVIRLQIVTDRRKYCKVSSSDTTSAYLPLRSNQRTWKNSVLDVPRETSSQARMPSWGATRNYGNFKWATIQMLADCLKRRFQFQFIACARPAIFQPDATRPPLMPITLFSEVFAGRISNTSVTDV